MRKNRHLKDRIVMLIQSGMGVSSISKVLKCSECLVRYHMKKRKVVVRVPKGGRYGFVRTTGYASGGAGGATDIVGLTLEHKAKMDGKPWVETAKALRAKAVEFLDCAAKLEKLANGGGGL